MQKDADQRLFDLREKKRIFCTVRKSSFFFKNESCFAGFFACGGSPPRRLPHRRSVIFTKRFPFYDLCMEKESIS